MTRYLTVLDVLGLHQAIMLRTGGEPALRDEALLESAVMRPRMAAHYDQSDLAMQAALLTSGIVLAHTFVDGNKRTAVLAGMSSFNSTAGGSIRNRWSLPGKLRRWLAKPRAGSKLSKSLPSGSHRDSCGEIGNPHRRLIRPIRQVSVDWELSLSPPYGT
jgi:hypothetical protein